MGAQGIRIVCSTGMSFGLPRGATVLLKHAAGARIVCRAGTLWMSEYRCHDDQVLSTGQSVVVGGNHDVVLSGLPQARAEVIESPECQ